MASRRFYFQSDVDKDPTTTEYVGDKIDYVYTSGVNEPFGQDTPTYISFYFDNSETYADFSGSVTIEYEIRLKINGTWYTVHERRSSMNINSDFSVYNIYLNSTIVNLLKQYSINEIALYHAGDRDNRGITARMYAPGYCEIEYEKYIAPEPQIMWENKQLNVSQINSQISVTWQPAYIANNTNLGPVQYTIVCLTDEGYSGNYFSDTTINTSMLFTPPKYNEQLFIQITAWAENVNGSKYSDGVYLVANYSTLNYTIRCYIDNNWQDCIVKYYDGTQWIDCIPKYYDGTQWVECSF